MKVLWAHDHVFYRSSTGEIYSNGKLPYTIWTRYLSEFNTVHIIGRVLPIIKQFHSSSLTLSSGPNVRFTFVSSLANPKSFFFEKKDISRKIHQLVKGSDAVIARLPSFNGESAVKAALAEGKPYAIEMVACPWDSFWNYGNWQGRVMAPLVFLSTKNVVRKAPYVIYVTKKFLQNRYPTKGHSASVSNVLIPRTDESILHKRIEGMQQDSPLNVGMNGYLDTKYKGVQVAIKSINAAAKVFPAIRLKVLGNGNPRPWIEMAKKNGINDHVGFCGTLPSGPAVFQWLDSVDLYIQPSFQEGLPRALVEAMSRACPSLGSTAGGIPELLQSECLHSPGDYNKLSKDILKAYRNIEWRKQQAKRNFILAKDYSKEILDAKRAQFWRDFAGFVTLKK